MEGVGGGGRSCDDHKLLLLMSEDLLIQILLWLPVISLLRFKAVSKSWRSIIESPFFIHLHHATPLPTSSSSSSSSSSNLGSNNILLFLRSAYGEKEQLSNVSSVSGDEFVVFENLGMPPLQEEDVENQQYPYIYDVEDENLGLPPLQEEDDQFRRYHPYTSIYDEMVGCCDGIICLHDSMNRNITLWNPATKQYRFLPKPSLNHTFGNPNCHVQNDYYAQDFVRFGIDVKTKDQKVFQITTLKPCPASGAYERRSVHVYSSSTDSWRRIDDATLSAVHPDIDIEMNMNDRGYLNGRCFFTAQYRLNKGKDYFLSLILSFDFAEEILRTIQPPYERGSAYFHDNLFFIPFGEKLALADAKREKNSVEGYNSYYEDDDYDIWNYEYDIWVLNEQQHGVEEDYSWTKFYTFGPYRECSPPRCITNKGEFAIIYGWDWIEVMEQVRVLNLMTGETKHLQYRSNGFIDVAAYKPSLIPIGGSLKTFLKSHFCFNLIGFYLCNLVTFANFIA